MGKPKEYTIAGEKFLFKPLTVKELDLFLDMGTESKKAAAMKKIVSISLKQAVPEATDEEIESIGVEFFEQITSAILDVNGMNKDEQPEEPAKSA